MGNKVPWKIGVLIYLPVTSRPLISLQEEAVLSPCNFATTHLTACILIFYLCWTSRPMKRRTLSQRPKSVDIHSQLGQRTDPNANVSTYIEAALFLKLALTAQRSAMVDVAVIVFLAYPCLLSRGGVPFDRLKMFFLCSLERSLFLCNDGNAKPIQNNPTIKNRNALLKHTILGSPCRPPYKQICQWVVAHQQTRWMIKSGAKAEFISSSTQHGLWITVNSQGMVFQWLLIARRGSH